MCVCIHIYIYIHYIYIYIYIRVRISGGFPVDAGTPHLRTARIKPSDIRILSLRIYRRSDARSGDP